MMENLEDFSLDKKKSFTPMELVHQNLRYLPWVIASVILSAILAFIYLRYTPDQYAARGKMIIKENNATGTADERFNRLLLVEPGPNLTNEIASIRSTSFISRVIQNKKFQIQYSGLGNVRTTILYDDAPLLLEVLQRKDSTVARFQITILNDKEFLLQGRTEPNQFGEVIKVSNGSFRIHYTYAKPVNTLPTMEYSMVCLPLDIASEQLISRLTVKQSSEMGNIIDISYESSNKEIATEVVNAIMEEYGLANVEEKSTIAKNTIRFIEDRLDSLQSELSDVEGAIQSFREKNRGADLATQSLFYSQSLNEAEAKSDELNVKKKILIFLRNYIESNQNRNNTVPVNLGIEEPALLSLVSSYNQLQVQRAALIKSTTELNPKVVELDESMDKVRKDILESLNSIEQAYDISINRFNQKSQEAQRNAVSVPGKARQLLNIERQQKIKEELYLLLLSKKEEVAIAASAVAPNSTILERATNRPVLVEPIPRNVFVKFLLVGLLLPVFIILLISYFNDSIQSNMDIERLTSTPILGEVIRSDNPSPVLVTTKARSYITEQFRSLRNNLSFFSNTAANPVILVTSSISGEGKTFISTNIAAVFAVAGKRTLLMEFDIRKPKIASNLGVTSLAGISSVLVANQQPSNVVEAVKGIPNLFILPCGAIPPNPAELLLMPNMDTLFRWAKENFDIIVVDSAPVGIVSDAITLSKFADASLFIVRQDYTLKKAIELIDKLYMQKKLPNMSIVLNDVKLSRGHGYGYGYGYGLGNVGSDYFDLEKEKKSSLVKKLLKK